MYIPFFCFLTWFELFLYYKYKLKKKGAPAPYFFVLRSLIIFNKYSLNVICSASASFCNSVFSFSDTRIYIRSLFIVSPLF